MSGTGPVCAVPPAPASPLPAAAPALAELAFGSLSRTALSRLDADGRSVGRHLALLPADALELDLADPQQRRLGDYELLELVGEGGMGVVYRARQLSLDREVAVKLLAAGPWASREFIERFRREAQNAARMQHPNIVTVFEVGMVEELHFFSMALVRGQSLAAKLRRDGPLAARPAAMLMRTIAEAVDYAHSLNVLHLDLKPANVLLDEAGVPHVADFGLARRLDRALALDNTEISGTPSYMAPEQASLRQHKLSVATDIWGLGAILYELVTGQPPFRGDSAQATLHLVVEGQVAAPRRAQPALPLDLEAVILKCLARDPAERYASARALADDLSRFVDGRAVRARPLNLLQRTGRWAQREPKLAATALLALGALLLGLVATTQQWQRAEHNAERAQANAATARTRLWDSRDEASLRFMDAGDGWKAAPLLLANIAEQEAQGEHARAAGARKRLGILENANPVLIDVLPALPASAALALSPNARHLAASTDVPEVRLFDLASGRPRWDLAPERLAEHYDRYVYRHIGFSADGASVLLHSSPRTRAAPFPFGLFSARIDVDSGQPVVPPPGDRGYVGFSADGHQAITFTRAHGAQSWAGEPWRALGPARKLPGVAMAGPVLLAPDQGSFAFRRPDSSTIGVFAANTLQAEWEFAAPGFGRHVAWAFSPDSRWIAIGDLDGHVVVADRHTRELRPLQSRPLTGVGELVFSDDGHWLAAATGKGGVYLWQWPEGRLLVPPFATASQPDRVRLDRAHARVLASGASGSASLWQIPAAEFEMDRIDAVPLGERIATLAAFDGDPDAIAWQPQQHLLAHVAARRIQLERLPPPVLKRASAAPIQPTSVRFDGQRLATVDGARVRLLDAMTEAPLRDFELPQAPGFAELTRDGRTLVATAGRLLHAFDAASGQPRFAPVALANSPQHVEISPDGTTVLTGWLDHDGNGAVEVVQAWSLRDGARVRAPVRFSGVLDELRFDPAGTRLLLRGAMRLSLRDGRTLAPIAGPLADLVLAPHDDVNEGFASAAAFDANGELWLSIQRPQAGTAQLRHYASDGTLLDAAAGPPLFDLLPLADGTLLEMPERAGLQQRDAHGTIAALPDPARDSTGGAIAASRDGRWFARATRDGAVVFDARQRTSIAHLHAPLPAPDLVWQLAFSPDGGRLLARSLRNRVIVWNIAADARPVAQIARELALRDVRADVVPAQDMREPSDDERAALRARDPGKPPEPATAPPPAVRLLPGGAIPPRDPATPAELLDLTSLYTFGLSEAYRPALHSTGDYGWAAQGVQRLLGVDYDLRGGIQLQAATGVSDAPRGNNPASVRLRAPRPDVAALDLLLLRSSMSSHLGANLLTCRFEYADGRVAEQPVTIDHVGAYYQRRPPAGARIAAFGLDARAYAGASVPAHVYAVRLANPHPAWPVRAIRLAAAEDIGASAVLLAATVEPAPSAAGTSP